MGTATEGTTATNGTTEKIIGCVIEVHRVLGPGLYEATYESALCVELGLAGLKYERQAMFPIRYKEQVVGDFRLDLLVEDRVVVEVKATERLDPIFDAQVLTYLRATGKRVGLLVNFNTRLLKSGLKRFVN